MSVRWVMGLIFLWFMNTLVLQMLDGAYISAAEGEILNQMSGFKTLESGDVLAIPLLSGDFFSGISQVLRWDYDILHDGFAILRWIMYAVSIGIIWGILQTYVPAMMGALSNLLRFR